MKVIFLEDIKNIGKKFEIKEMKDGYVRNFLLPKKLVMVATDEALKKLNQQKTVWEEKRNKIIKQLQDKVKELESANFSFGLKAGEKGEVFGSVTKKDIEIAVREKFSLEIKINLEKPLKALGAYSIEADLGEGVKAKLNVVLEKI